MSPQDFSRRTLLKTAGCTVGSIGLSNALVNKLWAAPALITSDRVRPRITHGLQFGDVTSTRGLLWSRSDRPARMMVEYAYDPDFYRSFKVRGPYALPEQDFTARLDLSHLIPNRTVFVRVSFADLTNERNESEAWEGQFTTAPEFNSRDLHFLWSGDTAGQGWGINPDFGGMRIYESMRLERPDFFIHSGDTVYADGPIAEYQDAEGGAMWRNIVTPEVSKVAETQQEFRGRYQYNMLDDNVRAFNAEVPQIWQWDDHEVVNNWSDAKDLADDDRYTEKNVPLLVARGTQAFMEYAPIRPFDSRESERVYRHIPYGALLDVFVLDMRSYRGPNTANDQTIPGPETQFFGWRQLSWLKHKLLQSRSVWKVIAADMPIGLIVRDGAEFYENMANGDGAPTGRELEMAELLRFIKHNDIDNIVWLTADVHYCAAHHYTPENAAFKDFKPFWEFVAGPLNAGSFGPNELDNTFGPEVVFQQAPPAANLSPLAGFQFYGDVKIAQYSSEMTVSLKNIDGETVFSRQLTPEYRRRGHGGWRKQGQPDHG